MVDLKRLNDLHAATTQGPWHSHNIDDSASMNIYCVTNSPIEPSDGNDACVGAICATLLQSAGCVRPRFDSGVESLRFEEDASWIAESHNAWPAVAARLALLEEFVGMVRYADEMVLDETKALCIGRAIAWLESETKKAGQ